MNRYVTIPATQKFSTRHLRTIDAAAAGLPDITISRYGMDVPGYESETFIARSTKHLYLEIIVTAYRHPGTEGRWVHTVRLSEQGNKISHGFLKDLRSMLAKVAAGPQPEGAK